MKLVSGRLQNFRLFEDTGEVPLDRITVLLAQNENGKTAFLQGLAWFSDSEQAELDEEDVHQDAGADFAVTLVFEREKGDDDRLKPFAIRLPKRLRATRGADGLYRFEDADTDVLVEAAAEVETRESLGDHAEVLRAAVEDVTTASVYKGRALRTLTDFQTWDPKFRSTLVRNSVTSLVSELEPEAASGLEPALSQFLQASNAVQAAHEKATSYILGVLPKLIYFDAEVELLPDRATYAEMKGDPEAHRTILNLGRLAGVDFNRIPDDPHRRLQKGRQFQETISHETSRFWRGHEVTFEVGLDAEGVTVSVVSAGRFQKPSRRSRGMRWYHGFHINFMAETKRELKNAVLLIDEPGLFLHPSAQEGLLDLFEEIGRENQIVYSTHLPFMIPREHPERIRLLVEQEDGSVVVESRPHRHSDADVMKPIRAAVGMTIADTISLGTRSLICEGIADLYILRAASTFAERTARASLPKSTTLLPAGGADKILTLASFVVGEVIDGVVLVDDDSGGRRVETQIEKRFASLVPVVRTHDTPRSESASGLELEDLFDDEYYCGLVNESHAHVEGYAPLSQEDIAGSGGLVDRVKAAFADRELGGFQKLLPATAFAARVEAGAAPDDATLDRFAELFDRLRAARRA